MSTYGIDHVRIESIAYRTKAVRYGWDWFRKPAITVHNTCGSSPFPSGFRHAYIYMNSAFHVQFLNTVSWSILQLPTTHFDS